jgi:hypothetical protein
VNTLPSALDLHVQRRRTSANIAQNDRLLGYDHSCLDGVRNNIVINKIIRLVNNTPIAINDITGIKMSTP